MAEPKRQTREPDMKVYAVLSRKQTNRSKFIIQIAKWDDGPIVIEKRQLIIDDETKKERVGRCRGLTGMEYLELSERKDEIVAVFNEHDEYFRTKLRANRNGNDH